VMDIREAIGLEITAERMGASVFGNSAMPSMIFKHGATSRGFKTDEEEKRFIEDFQNVYAKKGRFKSMILPFGMEIDSVGIDNEKAQFLATRQYQRTVIAGAFGVPPHMVGDLSRGTFNNVEQQSLDFVLNVVLPYVRIFEAAMERSLLTDEDRRDGVSIRFNLEGALRGDFKSRQEGLKLQREMGVISPNDWREQENMNPISKEDGGEAYWMKGPSGQGGPAADEQPADQAVDARPANDDEPVEGQNARDA
jgi:HK97 family phage portal protein